MDRAVWSFRSILLMTIVLRIAALTQAGPAAHLVPRLPGQPNVTFNQYAGYITVDPSHGRKLFYYFVEAQNSSATKPLVLWLNGGPGCSSLQGAFTELGPFFPNASGDSLIVNNDSWNQVANIIFLDSPAGTGFSYSNNISDYYTNDTKTAEDALAFLLGWLTEYPEHNSTEFYISGESYAGHFVPQLANAILSHNNGSAAMHQPLIQLKGIMVGNPLLDLTIDFEYARFLYAWTHGLISEAVYNTIVQECNYTSPPPRTPACTSAQNTAYQQMDGQSLNGDPNNILFNPYDVLVDKCLRNGGQSLRLNEMLTGMEFIVDPCLGDELQTYLNLPKVESSLHTEVSGWSACINNVSYDQQNSAIPMLPVLASLVASNLRIWIYSGDQDVVVPLIGTRKIVTTLADYLGLNTTFDYQLWLQGSQIGGWSMSWGNGSLVFATVRDAGHMVAMYQPERSLLLFSSFLAGDNSPPLQPTNG